MQPEDITKPEPDSPRHGILPKALTMQRVNDEDRERYRDAANGCLGASILQGVIVWISSLYAQEPALAPAWAFFSSNSLLLFSLFIAFIASWLATLRLYPKSGDIKKPYLIGTICNTVSFLIPTTVIAILVHLTGGLGSSLHSALFVSLFGLSLFVPRDRFMKFLLFFITLILGVIIVLKGPPNGRAHDWVVLFQSVLAYASGIVVKFFLDTVSSK
jgi:hypothetical protein